MTSKKNQQSTALFPKEEKVGFRQDNKVIIFSASSLKIETNITFPFPILFYSLPFDNQHALIISADDPSLLVLWNFQLEKEESNFKADSEIINFVNSRTFSCLVTESTIFIVRSNPLVLHKTINIIDTISRQKEVAVSIVNVLNDDSHCLFAYSTGANLTNVSIQRIPSTSQPILFEAHKSPIRHISIADNGKYLATVSDKGTIIRIWSLSNGKMLHESRRGLTPAVVVHMSFSPCSSFLCVSSNHMTSHIIKIPNLSESSNSTLKWLTFLPKANMTVPNVTDTKMFSSFVLTGGKTLCSVTDKGVCDMYDIDVSNNKFIFRSRIMVSKIARIATSKSMPLHLSDQKDEV